MRNAASTQQTALLSSVYQITLLDWIVTPHVDFKNHAQLHLCRFCRYAFYVWGILRIHSTYRVGSHLIHVKQLSNLLQDCPLTVNYPASTTAETLQYIPMRVVWKHKNIHSTHSLQWRSLLFENPVDSYMESFYIYNVQFTSATPYI